MNCLKATQSYESWLAKHTTIIKADLRLKHHQMSDDVFSFMRGTFYRWVELWPGHCADLFKAPAVLAVGDLHVENFGTWRDKEGRLVWGINDFDEAFRLPYTNDLVRLATSAHLAISANHLALEVADACNAIITGYRKGLTNARPFVLAENHEWLRSTVTSQLRDPTTFWDKLNGLRPIRISAPRKAVELLERALPSERLAYRLVHRIAGIGSLGRQRYAVLADWEGAHIAREAKALVASACVWLNHDEDSGSCYETIVQRAVRCPDPSISVRKSWVVRRLAPDCSRVELNMLPKGHDEYRLLEAMGRETANIHAGSEREIAKVRRDLRKRSSHWLHTAAETMVQAITEDWSTWRRLTERISSASKKKR